MKTLLRGEPEDGQNGPLGGSQHSDIVIVNGNDSLFFPQRSFVTFLSSLFLRGKIEYFQ
jgi:hypothetical protein